MTDIRADDAMPLDEEDRLPWLEAVDEDDERDGPSPLKLIAAVVIGLIAIGLVVGGLFWIGGRESSSSSSSDRSALRETSKPSSRARRCSEAMRAWAYCT